MSGSRFCCRLPLLGTLRHTRGWLLLHTLQESEDYLALSARLLQENFPELPPPEVPSLEPLSAIHIPSIEQDSQNYSPKVPLVECWESSVSRVAVNPLPSGQSPRGKIIILLAGKEQPIAPFQVSTALPRGIKLRA